VVVVTEGLSIYLAADSVPTVGWGFHVGSVVLVGSRSDLDVTNRIFNEVTAAERRPPLRMARVPTSVAVRAAERYRAAVVSLERRRGAKAAALRTPPSIVRESTDPIPAVRANPDPIDGGRRETIDERRARYAVTVKQKKLAVAQAEAEAIRAEADRLETDRAWVERDRESRDREEADRERREVEIEHAEMAAWKVASFIRVWNRSSCPEEAAILIGLGDAREASARADALRQSGFSLKKFGVR
jgi:hypothetical protein